MQATSNTPPPVQSYISYIVLRRGIGIIAFALPILLLVGSIFVQPGILYSISAYYHSSSHWLRDIFVGSMCAVGVFLLSYRYERRDNILSILAGAFAIGVALFPTCPDKNIVTTYTCNSLQPTIFGWVHWICGVGFLVSLAVFAFCLFTKSSQGGPTPSPIKGPTPQKEVRNCVYRCCGVIIGICIVLCGIFQIFLSDIHLVFWFETAAVFAFSFAWFVKGETILTDDPSKSYITRIRTFFFRRTRTDGPVAAVME